MGVVCIFSVLNHEVAEFHADATISRLEKSVDSLEARIEGLSTLVSADKSVAVENKTQPDYKYLIREQNGKVVVLDSEGKVLQEIGIPLAALPKADREMLAKGIKIKSDAELYSLIQDYIG